VKIFQVDSATFDVRSTCNGFPSQNGGVIKSGPLLSLAAQFHSKYRAV
jgi:hypothetical protein